MGNTTLNRREFIQKSIAAGLAMGIISPLSLSGYAKALESKMKFGLVTYQWGKDWDLPTLIRNCEKTDFLGVELRTEHAHAVEIDLSDKQRAEVKKRFADSPVECVGYGSNYEYHSPDAKELQKNIEGTKEYIRLCQDIGATGLKVKPNTLPEGVEKEKTIAQIAGSLNEVGKYAQDYGQLIRVEVHGKYTQELPNMKVIFDQVEEPNVKICWNSNDTDLNSPGLEANFNMVKEWFGDTVHVRAFDENDYPFPHLFKLFHQIDYQGWILLEAHSDPDDKLTAMRQQITEFKEILASF